MVVTSSGELFAGGHGRRHAQVVGLDRCRGRASDEAARHTVFGLGSGHAAIGRGEEWGWLL